jgi:hypothetical protein
MILSTTPPGERNHRTMSDAVEQMARDIADNPAYYGLRVYRQNPCCYGDQAEATVEVSFGHFDDAEDAATKLLAVGRAVEILIDRFRQHGEIETVMGVCEGCEVSV